MTGKNKLDRFKEAYTNTIVIISGIFILFFDKGMTSINIAKGIRSDFLL